MLGVFFCTTLSLLAAFVATFLLYRHWLPADAWMPLSALSGSWVGGTANMMLAELIAQFVQSLVNWGMGAAAAFALLVITLGLYTLQLKLFGASRMGGA